MKPERPNCCRTIWYNERWAHDIDCRVAEKGNPTVTPISNCPCGKEGLPMTIHLRPGICWFTECEDEDCEVIEWQRPKSDTKEESIQAWNDRVSKANGN